MGATSYDFDGLSVPVYKAPAKPEVTTDFFVMKHLRDLEMKKKIQERNQVYGQIAPANLGQSQANPSVVAAMTNNQSVNNVSATSISAPISPLNQTIVGNW